MDKMFSRLSSQILINYSKHKKCETGFHFIRKIFNFYTKDYPKSSLTEYRTKNGDLGKFNDTYPLIITNFLSNKEAFYNSTIVEDYVKQVFEYNVPYGNQNRPQILIETYRALNPNTNDNQMLDVYKIAWLTELLQVTFDMIDDVTDKTTIKGGQETWVKNVGNIATNDAVFLYVAIDVLLKTFFESKQYYDQARSIFREVKFSENCGLMINFLTWKPETRHNSTIKEAIPIAENSSTPFILSANLAMYMTNLYDLTLNKDYKDILIKMGWMQRIRSDYNTCFIGHEDNQKYSYVDTVQMRRGVWLYLLVIQQASESNVRLLKEHFNRVEKDSVETILNIYQEMDVPKLYRNFMNEQKISILNMIEQKIHNNKCKEALESLIKFCDYNLS